MKPERIKELALAVAVEANKCCGRSDGYEEDILAHCEQAIATAVREALEGAWTAVKDGLPDDDITVLIEMDDGEVWTGYHDGDDGWRYVCGDPLGSCVVGWAHFPAGRTKRA